MLTSLTGRYGFIGRRNEHEVTFYYINLPDSSGKVPGADLIKCVIKTQEIDHLKDFFALGGNLNHLIYKATGFAVSENMQNYFPENLSPESFAEALKTRYINIKSQ